MQTKQVLSPHGDTIAYSTIGTGTPVLLLHGFTMWSAMWDKNGVVGALSGKHRLGMPDIMGHGHSGRPHDAAHYGLNLLRDVDIVLTAEGIDRAHVVGFSLGAELALKLAATTPERVASLFLIGSGWTPPKDMAIYRSFAAWAREKQRAMTPEPDYDALDALADGMPQIINLTRGQLERINVPSAGVVGGEDAERPNLEALQGTLPGFTLDVLPGVPHETSWRDPSIPDRVRAFLDAVRV